MSKTKLTYKAALERVAFLQRDNDAGKGFLKKAYEDIKALEARNAELLKWRDEAKKSVDAWREHASAETRKNDKLERDAGSLAGTIERLRERLEIANSNIQRLQGWIDCKQGRDPRIETEVPF